MASKPSLNLVSNAIFSALFIFGLAMVLGAGLELVLVAAPVLLLANGLFSKWNIENVGRRIISVTLRSILLAGALFGAAIVFIKLGQNGGQLGYGDQLQIDGSEITLLGYWVILRSSLQISAIAWLSALLTSIALNRRHGN